MNRRQFLKRAVQAAAAVSAAAVVGRGVGGDWESDDYSKVFMDSPDGFYGYDQAREPQGGKWSWWQKTGSGEWEFKTSAQPFTYESLPESTISFVNAYSYKEAQVSQDLSWA